MSCHTITARASRGPRRRETTLLLTPLLLLLPLAASLAVLVPRAAAGGIEQAQSFDATGTTLFRLNGDSDQLPLDLTLFFSPDGAFSADFNNGSVLEGSWTEKQGVINASVKKDAKQALKQQFPGASVKVPYYKFKGMILADGKIGGLFRAKYKVSGGGVTQRFLFKGAFGGTVSP